MPDAAAALLQADVDVNSGANGNAIRHAFCERGIFSGAQCTPITNDFTLTAAPRTEAICAGDDGEYWLNVSDLGTFANPVTLGVVSGNPAGTTVTFSPNPATPDSIVVMTVTGTGGVASGTSSIVLSATAAPTTKNDTVALRVQTLAAAPALTAPANGSGSISTTPTFTWTGDGQTNNYLVEVATDSTFSNVVLSATTTLTSYTAGTALQANTVYYWRVTPSNLCGDGTASAIYVFSTGSTAPTAVSLGTLTADSHAPLWWIVVPGLVLMAGALVLRRKTRA